MDVGTLATRIHTELRAVGTPDRAVNEKEYLKSDLEFLGAAMPEIKRATKVIARDYPDLSRTDLLALVRRLWKPGIFELRMAAVSILERYEALLTPPDLKLIERLLRQSKTWALVDPLAASVVGRMAERDPVVAGTLDRWAADSDFWIRRSALLALLKPLRAGEGDFDRFGRYADTMLEEKEFFIRKAIGWVLRETAKTQPGLVAAWVGPRTDRMSGVTIREAVKRLPPQVGDAFLQAYRDKRPALSD
ncbi:MAG: DNA alkylation repair protein [Acidimicrobiia bacterium]|nr:DNA alkylation repair protein [Acidimicrobiia bacterium]